MRNEEITFGIEEADAVNLVREYDFPHEPLLKRPYLNASAHVRCYNKAGISVCINTCNLAIVLFLLLIIDEVEMGVGRVRLFSLLQLDFTANLKVKQL